MIIHLGVTNLYERGNNLPGSEIILGIISPDHVLLILDIVWHCSIHAVHLLHLVHPDQGACGGGEVAQWTEVDVPGVTSPGYCCY